MNFILPDQFADDLESLRAVFKTKGDSKVTLLAQQRVSRAKKMMTPFVLRRRKDQVMLSLGETIDSVSDPLSTGSPRLAQEDGANRVV